MADRRRIVTITPAGTVTTVKDVEDSTIFFSVAGSFQVKPAERQQNIGTIPRRYAGQIVAGETHGNAEITWKALVKGGTVDQCVANLEGALGALELTRRDLHFEWRADGATSSSFFEIRGPAKYTPTYQWAQMFGAQSMYVDIAIPVGPLAKAAQTSQTFTSTTMPAVVSLTSIAGDAPALADISLRTTGGTNPPIWALIGWSTHPGTPLASSVAPFGIIEAETGTSLATWASTANAIYRGGNALQATLSGAGSASALYAVDPSVMQPDEFSAGEVAVEVWARITSSAAKSLRFFLSLQPAAGLSFGNEQFSAEFGSAGKLISDTLNGFAFIRLGTVNMPVDAVTPLKWNVKVAASWTTGSAGTLGLDYLVMVPARQRALSPSGEPNDASYPDFIASTADTTKTIRADLSGLVGSAALNQGRDSGLGGSPIELPPGLVDLVIVLSSVVADDPTAAGSMQLSHAASGSLAITPRYWWAKGT